LFVAKKSAVHLVAESAGSNELSRLVTKHRLESSGVKLTTTASADPDLDELVRRVRSATGGTRGSAQAVPADIVRKLASG
jgi:hypothetical protein